nr:metallophosphoesterase [Desulfobacula sp.]
MTGSRTLSFFCLLFLCAASFFACNTPHNSTPQTFLYQTDKEVQALLPIRPDYPDTRFAVVSDLHFYDKSLGVSGSAFQKYLDGDRKLLALSEEITAAAMEKISKEKVRFVIIPGDLTKDGERINHEGVVKVLKKLEYSRLKVYVVPGNHDINNGAAVQYAGDETKPVSSVNDKDFEVLYHEFGYNETLSRDKDSLSYVLEPEEGLWLLGLDSCKWKENQPRAHPLTGGAFSASTLAWIESQLILAKKENKAVLAFMHHGIMEHYPANQKFYGQYIVDDSETVSKLLAAYGVRLVFTGHYHAQDVTQKEFKDTGDFIFDIETGSLATAPCPYRVVEIKDGHRAVIKSVFIDAIPSMKDKFSEYARDFVFNGTVTMANARLDKYWVSKAQQPLITGQVAKAYGAHLSGDEKKPDPVINPEGFGPWLRFIAWMQKDLINGWWTDLPPKDNDLVIDLATGAVN